MKYRPYQQEIHDRIVSVRHGNTLVVLPTGGGKTVVFSRILAEHPGRCVAIAHRQELVGQMSVTLAKMGVEHSIMAPTSVIKWIVTRHIAKTGRSYYSADSRCTVAGVGTLRSRVKAGKIPQRWLDETTLWVCDEGHHLLVKNEWGKAMAVFPNARGLGVTATPRRADGRGLGRDADGVYDRMIVGPTGRELISQGYLTDYRIFAPPNDIDLGPVEISSSTGDYNPKQLKLQIRKSRIVGDVVVHYQRLAPGKIGVVFASDVETATDMANSFRQAGVPAEVVTAKTPDPIRASVLDRLEKGVLKVVVNVDLFGEGFDLPAIEVVILARPTESYALHAQQFGRGLRIMEGKERAIIIDHVGNVQRHGLPDAPQQWTLDRRERRVRGQRDPDLIPVRTCPSCLSVFEGTHKVCPFCQTEIMPTSRSAPEFVDGDLTELSPEVLARMRREADKVLDEPANSVWERVMNATGNRDAARGAAKKHVEKQDAQRSLRDKISLWAGWQDAFGRPRFESYRRFFWKFGVDVLSAQALNRADSEVLREKIETDILKMSTCGQGRI